jgi:hypothetical protein
MPVANLSRHRVVRPPERLKPPLELRNVRLRGPCPLAGALVRHRAASAGALIRGLRAAPSPARGRGDKPRWLRYLSGILPPPRGLRGRAGEGGARGRSEPHVEAPPRPRLQSAKTDFVISRGEFFVRS